MELRPHPNYGRIDPKPSAGLVDSMREVGQLHPIKITPDGVILSGVLRYLACQQLGIEPITEVITDPAQHFYDCTRA